MTQIAWVGAVVAGAARADSSPRGLGTAVGHVMGARRLLGESGGSPGETDVAPGTSGVRRPIRERVTLVAAHHRPAICRTAFASALQVALTNSDGCPVTTPPRGAGPFQRTSSGATGCSPPADLTP